MSPSLSFSLVHFEEVSDRLLFRESKLEEQVLELLESCIAAEVVTLFSRHAQSRENLF